MAYNPFPPEAWPALAEFDANKLVSLQLQFDQTEPGSPERRKVQAEIAEFTEKFKISAEKLLRTERQLDLERVKDLVQSQREFQARISRDIKTLHEADLTFTEMRRLGRLLNTFADPTTENVAQALEALQNRQSPGSRKRNRNTFTNY